jgi:hypothetical protein
MKTLRQLFPNIHEVLYEPADKDSRRLFNFRNRFNVDDAERYNKPGTMQRDPKARDRNGNRQSVFSGSTKTYSRSKNRYGYDSGQDVDSYDLGKPTAPINRQKPPSRGTVLPVVTVQDMKDNLTPEELAEQGFVVDAVGYLRGIEDDSERQAVMEHFVAMFSECHPDFNSEMFEELVTFVDHAE